MTSVVVVIPVLDRPQAAGPVVASLVASVGEIPCRPLFVLSPDDDAELAAVLDTGSDFLTLDEPVGIGDYAKKINLGYRTSTEEWIFTGADDLRFYPGWADRAIAAATPSIGVVGTNDLGNGLVIQGKHSTHSLIRRSYATSLGTIDQPGQIYCELYDHMFCDNELIETAVSRDAFVSVRSAIVEHLHPIWRKASTDATYARGDSGYKRDQALYAERRKLWGKK